MKKILLGGVSLLALASGANAADMAVRAPAYKAPPPAAVVASWTGFYLGVQGGVAWHEASFKDLDGFFVFPPGTSRSSRATGGIVGGNVGYNWQTGNFVLGVEADANWTGAKAGEQVVLQRTLVSSFDVRWMASLRARAGIAFDATLFYLTGGIAFGGVNDSANQLSGGAVLNRFGLDSTRAGATYGGGIEHMFARNWTVRAEGRVTDFGRSTVTCPATGCGSVLPGQLYRGEFSNRLITGLVALDYKF